MRIFTKLATFLGLAILLSACSTLDIASHRELQGVKAQVNTNTSAIAANTAAIDGLTGKINRGNRHLFDRVCSTSGDGFGTRNLLQKRMKSKGGALKAAANDAVTMEQIRILACMGIHSEGDFSEEAYLHGGRVLVDVEAYLHTSGRKVVVVVKDGSNSSVSATLTGTHNGSWSVK